MSRSDIEDRLFNLEKARENQCPGTIGSGKIFFLEFIEYVANKGDGPIKEMARQIYSKYNTRKFYHEQQYNVCKDAMTQIQKDMMNGTLIFDQEGDRKAFKGTDVTVVGDSDGVTIRRYDTMFRPENV